jgi:hypothetical protein
MRLTVRHDSALPNATSGLLLFFLFLLPIFIIIVLFPVFILFLFPVFIVVVIFYFFPLLLFEVFFLAIVLFILQVVIIVVEVVVFIFEFFIRARGDPWAVAQRAIFTGDSSGVSVGS